MYKTIVFFFFELFFLKKPKFVIEIKNYPRTRDYFIIYRSIMTVAECIIKHKEKYVKLLKLSR